MATQRFANNFRVALASQLEATDTTLVLSSAVGLPVLSNGDWMLLTLFRLSGINESGHEVVKVTARSGVNCTIERAYEGAAASQFTIAGTVVAARNTRKSLEAKADLSALIASIGQQYRRSEVLIGSGTYTARYTGWHRFTLVGASGSGAITRAQAGRVALATGGSSGGTVIKSLWMTAGDTLALVIGAAGGIVSITATANINYNINGYSANDCSLSGTLADGTSVNMVAGGGKGGLALIPAVGTVVAQLDGPVGGTASGGDFNLTGNVPGSCILGLASSIVTIALATGGVASPWYPGVSSPSGNAIANSTAGSTSQAATGGSGVGAKSGNATASTLTAIMASAGAGALSASTDATNTQVSSIGMGYPISNFNGLTNFGPLQLDGNGTVAVATSGTPTNTATATEGAGSGAIACRGAASGSSPSTGGASLMGGSGAWAATQDAANVVSNVGGCLFGGSSGGLAILVAATTSSSVLTVGKAGEAFLVVETM